jgi:nicotinamidase-related amidase
LPARNEDLHGMVPDKSDVALVLLDVINDMDFEGAELLLPHALEAAPRIQALTQRAREADIPVIYVNDNFGRWRSDFRALIRHCTDPSVPGHPIVQMLLPKEDDYFILKPKHSGFFSTTLDVLLGYLYVRTLILAGYAGDICVLFTANDAYMRDFHLVVPCDCVASNDPDDNRRAVKQMERALKADITPSTELDLGKLKRRSGERDP